MSIFNKLIHYLNYRFKISLSPEMKIYSDNKGKKIQNTRVSNLSHIGNKKNIIIGKNVFIGHFNYLDGYKKLTIGNGCQITNNVSILTHSSHNSIRFHGKYYTEHTSKLIALKEGDVNIGEYTFVGANSVIMPGSKIGKGCIISAFSYVNGNFPDFSVIRGQPAVIVGSTKVIDNILTKEHSITKDFYYLNE